MVQTDTAPQNKTKDTSPVSGGENTPPSIHEEHMPHAGRRGGFLVGLGVVLHNLFSDAEDEKKKDTLTKVGDDVDTGTSVAGITQSAAHVARIFSKADKALSGKLEMTEEVLDKAGIIGAVASGGLVAVDGVIHHDTREMAAGTLGVSGALAIGAGGAAVGTAVGEWAGGIAGSFIPIPVVGTAVGVAVGGTIGEFVGGAAGAWAGSKLGTEAGEIVLDSTTRVADWVQGNNRAVREELTAKGISQAQLHALDAEGRVSAHEVREFLEQHHFATADVERATPKALADALAATLVTEAKSTIPDAVHKAAIDAGTSSREHVQAEQHDSHAETSIPLVFAKVHSQSRNI